MKNFFSYTFRILSYFYFILFYSSLPRVTIQFKLIYIKPAFLESNQLCAFGFQQLGLKGKNKLCLNINGQLIPSSENLKLLGVNIDNSLKFETHVKELCKKVNQKMHAFRKLRPFLRDQKVKVTFKGSGIVELLLLLSDLAFLEKSC